MLKKINRVDRKTIDQIFKTGRFVVGKELVLKFILNHQSPTIRVSFTAPKNVSKSAVKRNLLRRRGYAVLNKYLNALPKGFNGIFVFGKKSLDVFGGKINNISNPLKDLENEIEKIISKFN
jgi:ribonuclease P protein component